MKGYCEGVVGRFKGDNVNFPYYFMKPIPLAPSVQDDSRYLGFSMGGVISGWKVRKKTGATGKIVGGRRAIDYPTFTDNPGAKSGTDPGTSHVDSGLNDTSPQPSPLGSISIANVNLPTSLSLTTTTPSTQNLESSLGSSSRDLPVLVSNTTNRRLPPKKKPVGGRSVSLRIRTLDTLSSLTDGAELSSPFAQSITPGPTPHTHVRKGVVPDSPAGLADSSLSSKEELSPIISQLAFIFEDVA